MNIFNKILLMVFKEILKEIYALLLSLNYLKRNRSSLIITLDGYYSLM